MLALVLPSFARSCIAMKFGIAIAARMPMITTTIISSMRVKPFCILDIDTPPLPGADGPLRTRTQTAALERNRYAMQGMEPVTDGPAWGYIDSAGAREARMRPRNRAFPRVGGSNSGDLHETWPGHAQRTNAPIRRVKNSYAATSPASPSPPFSKP